MSEPQLISPMLDGYVMGDPMSDHNGVRCCPAMKNDSDDRYIVKIISNPASQKQLDALLLTGAYPDVSSAKLYFKDLADGVVEEVKILQQLSQSEGFICFKDHQVVEMEDGETGYDVYLLSDYRRTLERQFRRNPMTHLGAINLGLDICSALSVCRRAGYLYIDLKPSNIHIVNDKEYRIGDLGFIRLDSLKYASLPDKYRSKYTAPEISDAFSSLNTTVDIYALGLILYQAYNGGTLPEQDVLTSAEKLPSPEYADYEMSEIILKACDPNPQGRWQDPVQMGQALVSYMQRNGVNDVPIVPPAVPLTEEIVPEVEHAPEATEQIEIFEEEAETKQPPFEIVKDPTQTEVSVDNEAETSDIASVSDATMVYSEDDFGNLSFLSDTEDETTQEVDAEQIAYEEISEEVSQMMLQIDEIAEYEVPEPVVVPDAVEVPMPELVIQQEHNDDIQCEKLEEYTADNANDTDDACQQSINQEDSSLSEDVETVGEETNENTSSSPAKKKTLRNVVLIILAILLLAGGFLFYKFIYLQSIDAMEVSGDENSVTVSITTKTGEAKLNVVCADAYGNKMTKPVVNGKAEFNELLAGTEYIITVKIDGFHKLEGEYRKTYYTPNQTNIVQLNAVTGSEDGSAIISFTVDGADSEQWQISYGNEGGEDQTQTFTGHAVTLTGLTVGEKYSATLAPVSDLYLSGDQQISFVAQTLIYAENLAITSCKDGKLSVKWSTPENTQVDAWSVHCYNDSGYSETVMTDQTNFTFEGIDDAMDYIVEVSAVGQSVSQRTSIGENSITLDPISAQVTDHGAIKLSWSTSAQIPQGGWLISYTVADTDVQYTHTAEENEYLIKEAIPGHTYHITIQSADETPVVCAPIIIATKTAEEFSCSFGGPTITGKDISLSMCKKPDKEDWTRKDLKKSDYKTSFTVGENAAFVIKAQKLYGISDDDLTALYMITDSNGKIVNFGYEEFTWRTLWDYYYGELNLPTIPSSAGEYTVTVYFNGGLVGQQSFTVTQ